jgi:protocatechuate 3,4-dioxygenase beta subunit
MIRMVIFALAVSAVVLERPVPESTPVVGGPCEGCEAVFQGMPDPVTSHARIAPASEPGAPMMIEGVVVDASGVPVEGVIVYAYHTDDRGIYPRDERFAGQAAYRHGKLRGWAITDADGRYSFDTIRPAGYPETSIPAHVDRTLLQWTADQSPAQLRSVLAWLDEQHLMDVSHRDRLLFESSIVSIAEAMEAGEVNEARARMVAVCHRYLRANEVTRATAERIGRLPSDASVEPAAEPTGPPRQG